MPVRPEEPGDIEGVRDVVARAFGSDAEPALVDELRANGAVSLALVDVDASGAVRGHVLFSPVTFEPAREALRGAVALAPMAVSPEAQRSGVGTRLVRRALALLSERGCPAVVVLGHPEYYPRFGFAPARRFGLRCRWSDGDAFMALELAPGALAGGPPALVRYRPEFDRFG